MDEIRLTGEVESIIYENKENGYTVFSLTTEDDEVTCVGIVPQIHTGETLEIGGRWSIHPVYGRQIQVQYYEKSMPTTKSGMEKYLASGLIRGIGPKTAKKIVERFGEASFYVIEEKPEQLAEIRGLTYEKALQISQIFREQHELRRAMIFLQGFDVSPAYAMRIIRDTNPVHLILLRRTPIGWLTIFGASASAWQIKWRRKLGYRLTILTG